MKQVIVVIGAGSIVQAMIVSISPFHPHEVLWIV